MKDLVLPTCLLLLLSPLTALAESLPEGRYQGRGDGTNASMTIAGATGSVALGNGRCTGGMEGAIIGAGASRWRLTDGICTLEITRSGETYSFAPSAQTESACFGYGGQGCALVGEVQLARSAPDEAGGDELASRPARCELTVDGTSHGSGECRFHGDDDGSFQIHFPSGIFADVRIREKGVGDGAWTGPLPASHAHDPIGLLARDGACWSNATARVCAW